jgi:hypothetical protein
MRNRDHGSKTLPLAGLDIFPRFAGFVKRQIAIRVLLNSSANDKVSGLETKHFGLL